MKNIDIVAVVTAYRNGTTMKLPAKIAWTRRVNMEKLFQAHKIINDALNEARAPFLDDEHSTVAENGRQIHPEYAADFLKAQDDILSQDTDVDIKKVRIEDLGDITISDSEMDTLAFMLEE